MNFAEFLTARLDEDEAVARAASPGEWRYGGVESVAGGSLYDSTRRILDVTYEQAEDHDGSIVRHLLAPEADANGTHIARHDPARVLAEVEAKRQIVALHLPVTTYRAEVEGETYTSCPVCDPFPSIDEPDVGACQTLRLLALPYACPDCGHQPLHQGQCRAAIIAGGITYGRCACGRWEE